MTDAPEAISALYSQEARATADMAAAAAASMYEVRAEATLSKIAKSVYGDATACRQILAANKPMLTDPNKIYPGRKLRIPPKA